MPWGGEYGGSGKSKRAAELSFSSSFCWWARVDSNHRSVTQQIYSLSPLATREHAHILLLWLCEKLRSSQRLFIIAGRNEKCKPFFKFFKSFFQRKGKSNRGMKKSSIKREKTKRGLGRAWRRAGGIYAERWGKAIAFCIFRVEKRAVPLGRETAL